MPDFKKTGNINLPTNIFVTLAALFLQTIYFFSASYLIEIKQYHFPSPTVKLAKLNMRKHYVSLTFIKLKVK